MLTFRPRAIALEALCVAGVGPVARALATRALARDDAWLATLRGVTSGDALFLLGASEALPWVDGALYLGRDDAAPLLLTPTNAAPDVPADVFERAIVRHAGVLVPPIAVLPAPRRLVSVAAARPVERARLAEWLAARPESSP